MTTVDAYFAFSPSPFFIYFTPSFSFLSRHYMVALDPPFGMGCGIDGRVLVVEKHDLLEGQFELPGQFVGRSRRALWAPDRGGVGPDLVARRGQYLVRDSEVERHGVGG